MAKTTTKPASEKASKSDKAKKEDKKPKGESEGEYGLERSHDLPWNEKKVAVFKALKMLKATSASSAVSAQQVVERSSVTLTTRDVRHYVYHAKAAGLTGAGKVEGINGYGFWLTANGAKLDPVKELKKQEDAKAKKDEE